MSLPLQIHHFRHGMDRVHYIKLASWFRYLMSVQGGAPLMGGFLRQDHYAGLCLESFWEAWREQKGSSHAVYELHNDRLRHVIPFALHLDEGRGLRKSAVLVVHVQTIFGAETRQRFETELHAHWEDGLTDGMARDMMTRSQFHNGKGSTWRTRFLTTCLPKAAYTKQKAGVFKALFETIAEECTDLLENGIEIGGTTYFFCLVAVKGDAPALVKAGHFSRNFQCLGNHICWECLAGDARHPFEDCRRSPSYERSIFTVRPWDTPPPLSYVPGCPEVPESLFQRDPFHVYKQSIGGSFVASSIILLSELGYYNQPGQNSFEQLMDRMFCDFQYFLRHEWPGRSVAFIKHFTRTNLHFARFTSFPYARLKGGDIMLLTRWLRYVVLHGPRLNGARPGELLDHLIEVWHGRVVLDIAKAATGALRFFHIMHSSGLWLSRDMAKDLGDSCFQFCEAYGDLAMACHRRNLCRFSLVPSLHYFHHFYMDMKRGLAKENARFVASPSISNCEGDEDFIGKVSRVSRHVHPLVTNIRTLDRYLVKLHFVMEEGD